MGKAENKVTWRDGDIRVVNGRKYRFDIYYRRFKSLDKGIPEILCGDCGNDTFKLMFGNAGGILGECTSCRHLLVCSEK